MLELQNINFKYSNNKSVGCHVFKDFNLNIRENELISVLGPSGCGKSTLVSLIAGYLQKQSGKILLHSKEVVEPGNDRIVINQGDDLFFWLTVEENMKLVTKDRVVIEKYLKFLKLEKFYYKYPNELSGGMKKRLSLARALSADGDFILMDEPFSAFDSNLKEKLHLELLKIKKETNKTFLLVTHDIEEALFLSDKIIVLNSDMPTAIEKEFNINFGADRELKIKEQEIFFQIKNEILKYYR